MRFRYSPFFFSVFFLLLCSCELTINTGEDIKSPYGVPPRKFWAQNTENGRFYQLEAELLAQSRNCTVWVEKGSGVSISTADTLARTYENEILPKMLNTFGLKRNISYMGQIVARNIMEFADWLGDGDKKLCILLLDIKDSYKPGVNESYVAGYFWPGNFYTNDPSDSFLRYSNQCDMIYIDTRPSKPGSRESNATLAHELQHMMNFVTTMAGFADSPETER